MTTHEQRIGFYREWSSRAARESLSATLKQTKDRCARSAGIWSLIADALEADDDQRVRALTRNVVFLNAVVLVPSR
jgi:hypothetical protein